MDVGVLILLANTNTNIPSLFTASGNGATIGRSTENPLYPINAAQLNNPLLETADLVGQASEDSFIRRFIATFKSGGFVYIVSEDEGDSGEFIRITRICEDDSLSGTAFHSLYQTILTPCGPASVFVVQDATLSVLSNGEYVIVTIELLQSVYVCAYSLISINQAITNTYQSCVVNGVGSIPEVLLFGTSTNQVCSVSYKVNRYKQNY